MSLLPTAHAGQSYGGRRIDFFTVSGEVTRAEGHQLRLVDDDGASHDVRLPQRVDPGLAGDPATMLRVRSGPKQKSRTAAVIDHHTRTWMRTSHEATTLLSRLGVVRAANWWLAMLALIATALVLVWPDLHAFLAEMGLTAMAGVPAFDVRAELAARLPGAVGWDLAGALPAGILDAIVGLDIVAADRITVWGIALAGTGLALLAYLARSWRLVYVPLYAAFAVLAAVIFGAVAAGLLVLAGAAVLFMLGGAINRFRDAGRFEARVERLAEHVLSNPPEEGVRKAAESVASPDRTDHSVTAIASAAALASGEVSAAETGADDSVPDTSATPAPASPADEGSNGEVRALAESELPPPATADTPPMAPETELTAVQPPEALTTGTEDVSAPVLDAGDDAEADDLPSLEDVAAAAALTAAETASGEPSQGDSVQADLGGEPTETERPDPVDPQALEDERTMPVAAPPPMPSSTEAEVEAAGAMEEASEDAGLEAENASAATIDPRRDPGPLPLVDDPLMADGDDPMIPPSQASDLAPGVPEPEEDRDFELSDEHDR
ncbi:hypothetical protein [Maricaulis sp. CAU 1757]